MAYVIHGAGAIGGIIAARLQQAGQEVVVIARGANREALEARGLRFQSRTQDWRELVRVVGHPREIGLKSTDIVILAMKTQDTPGAVQDLAMAAPADMPIFCAQNGVENERLALRSFENVYGLYVFVFGAHLAPGVVQCFTAPSSGVLDLGRYPGGLDDVARRVSVDLAKAGFDSIPRPDIMRWKHAKLIANLANALDAICGAREGLSDLLEGARAEGRACYRAAGVAFVSAEESEARHQGLLPLQLVEGAPFPGGSTWQSLARGIGQTEIDYLTGEIVLLGRLHGVPTPINAALQRLVRDMGARRLAPGSMAPDELRARLAAGQSAADGRQGALEPDAFRRNRSRR
jgi:2-dehydropantoate 2-reductase